MTPRFFVLAGELKLDWANNRCCWLVTVLSKVPAGRVTRATCGADCSSWIWALVIDLLIGRFLMFFCFTLLFFFALILLPKLPAKLV